MRYFIGDLHTDFRGTYINYKSIAVMHHALLNDRVNGLRRCDAPCPAQLLYTTYTIAEIGISIQQYRLCNVELHNLTEAFNHHTGKLRSTTPNDVS